MALYLSTHISAVFPAWPAPNQLQGPLWVQAKDALGGWKDLSGSTPSINFKANPKPLNPSSMNDNFNEFIYIYI